MKVVASSRQLQGSSASRRLRRSAKVPGIIYGGNSEPSKIELDHNPLYHALRVEAFHSSILDMEIGNKVQKVLLRDIQWHPYKQQVLHIDFQRVSAKQKIHMKVPLHYRGEEESNAVKFDKCLVNHILNELEVSCLPADLPEAIEVDLSKLEKGATVTLKDIALPKGVEPVLRGHTAEDTVLVSVVNPAAEESDAATPAAEGDKK